MCPVFDPDAKRPPAIPSDADAIIIGFTRIRDPAFLYRYAEMWADEINDSGRRNEVEKAYRKRMKELTR